jgi:DNA-binding NarL/FixJ family response regulator
MTSAFTPREREVFGHVLRGESNKDIARKLGRSLKTVELHVSRVLKKAGKSSRIQLFASLLEEGRERKNAGPAILRRIK